MILKRLCLCIKQGIFHSSYANVKSFKSISQISSLQQVKRGVSSCKGPENAQTPSPLPGLHNHCVWPEKLKTQYSG